MRVDDADAGLRLDVFLTRRVDGLSRAGARRMIAAGHVVHEGRVARRGGVAVTAGERVELLEAPPTADFRPAAPDGSVTLRILFEDAYLVIVDKPAGVPTHPLRPWEANTLVNALLARHPGMEGVGYASREPGIVHRLDNETSGLLMAARDASTFDALRAALRSGAIDKRYEVLVEGPLMRRVIEGAIAPRGRRRVEAYVDRPAPADARAARTEILTTQPIGDRFTRATVRAKVAVRHQIRAHFAAIGQPLVGDERYGGAHREVLGRHFLHASSIAFVHPRTGAPVAVEAPLPEELRRFLEEAS